MRAAGGVDGAGAAGRLHDGRTTSRRWRRRDRRRPVVRTTSRSPIRASATTIRMTGAAARPGAMPCTAPTSPSTRPRSTGTRPRPAGISFAFIKATEGGDRVDDNFAEHWQRAKAGRRAAQRLSFLLFLPPGRRAGALVHPQRAARPLGAAAGARHGVEPALADLQAAGPPPATVRSEMRIFLTMVERHYGKKPIIYTSIDFFEDNDLSTFRGYPYWLRSVAGHPQRQIWQPPLHLLAVHRHRRRAGRSAAMPTSTSSTAAGGLEKVVEGQHEISRLNCLCPHFATGVWHCDQCSQAWTASAGRYRLPMAELRDGMRWRTAAIAASICLRRRCRRWQRNAAAISRPGRQGVEAEAAPAGHRRRGLSRRLTTRAIDPNVLAARPRAGRVRPDLHRILQPHGQRLPAEAGRGQPQEICRRLRARRGRSSACRRR